MDKAKANQYAYEKEHSNLDVQVKDYEVNWIALKNLLP